jgi:hypothetical protein
MDDSGGQVYVSSTYLTEEVSIALDVLVCVEPLTSPLKPALADTESDTSLPEVTVIPIVVFPFLSRSPLSSFKKLKRKAHSAKRISTPIHCEKSGSDLSECGQGSESLHRKEIFLSIILVSRWVMLLW